MLQRSSPSSKSEKEKDKDGKSDRARLSGTSAIASALNGQSKSSEMKKDPMQEQKKKPTVVANPQDKENEKKQDKQEKALPLGINFSGGTGDAGIDDYIPCRLIRADRALNHWFQTAKSIVNRQHQEAKQHYELVKRAPAHKVSRHEFVTALKKYGDTKKAADGICLYEGLVVSLIKNTWWDTAQTETLARCLDYAFNRSASALMKQYKENEKKGLPVHDQANGLNYILRRKLNFIAACKLYRDLYTDAEFKEKNNMIEATLQNIASEVTNKHYVDVECQTRAQDIIPMLGAVHHYLENQRTQWQCHDKYPFLRESALATVAVMLAEPYEDVNNRANSLLVKWTATRSELDATIKIRDDLKRELEKIADVMVWQEELFRKQSSADLILEFINGFRKVTTSLYELAQHEKVLEKMTQSKIEKAAFGCLHEFWDKCDANIKEFWQQGVNADEYVFDIQKAVLAAEVAKKKADEAKKDAVAAKADAEAALHEAAESERELANRMLGAKIETYFIRAADEDKQEAEKAKKEAKRAEDRAARKQEEAKRAFDAVDELIQKQQTAKEKSIKRDYLNSIPSISLSEYRQQFVNNYGSAAAKEKMKKIIIETTKREFKEAKAAADALEEKQKAFEALEEKCALKANKTVLRVVRGDSQVAIQEEVRAYLRGMFKFSESDIERLEDKGLILNDESIFSSEGFPSLVNEENSIFKHYKKILYPDYKPSDVKQIIANEVVALRGLLLDPGSVVDSDAEVEEINPECVIGWQNFYMVVKTAAPEHKSLRTLAERFRVLTASSDIKAKSRHFQPRLSSEAFVEAEQSVDAEQVAEAERGGSHELP